LASRSFLMGMWRDSIIFKRTRLCNCIDFQVESEAVASFNGRADKGGHQHARQRQD